jgi:2-polyprenyl-3-methyl-5-hydroxy-6-metoxy-1,4-benzoquinol methylase
MTCRFCGRLVTDMFVDLGVTPLCESYVRAEDLTRSEPSYPLHAFVCANCFLVQVPECVHPSGIFSDYAYFSSYSDSWLEHARRYAEEMMSRFGLGPAASIIEVGSNDGYLLQYFVRKGMNVLGIDPAANVAQAAISRGVPTFVAFFGEQVAKDLARVGTKADLLIGNNVLAQVPDLNDFVRGLKVLLENDGVITMEFPHLMKLVEQCQFDTIYHEHFSYFSFVTAERIFASHGMTIFDVEELPTHGGSLRIYARHSDEISRPVEPRAVQMREREIAAGLETLPYYAAFGEQVKATKRILVECLSDIKRAGKRIAAYGAPGKGNTLLNYCGIRGNVIDYAVDRNPYKQGKYTPGTKIPILAPDTISHTRPDYLLVLPWNLQTEIMEQMSYIREWGGRFIIPIPSARIC